MLSISLWKRLIVVAICLIGLLVAMPNVFYTRVETANDARAALERGDAETPDLAADAALWPSFLPSDLLNLGLDLRGGAHVLVEVNLDEVQADRLESLWPELRDSLRELRDQVGTVRRLDGPARELHIRVGDPGGMDVALEAVENVSQPVFSLTGAPTRDFVARAEGDTLIVAPSEAEVAAMNERAMLQSLEIIRRRVDETGTREPSIQRQGEDRILIQVPGIGSAEELLAIIGQTARLSFHPVVARTTDAAAEPGLDEVIYPSLDEPGVFYTLERRAVVTGDQLVDSQPSFDQNGQPAVNFRFNPQGGAAFGRYTAENIGSPFAIVLDEEVISAPVIQSHIAGGSGIITGNFSPEESTRLAILLRAGALPAEIKVLEQRTIGPELGQDSIEAGRLAAIVALAAVMVFMTVSYGLFGVFACLALMVNLTLIFALMTAMGATLTMPGVAGIVLTIGMAVDSNVLIFERIREELRSARGPARAIQLGFEKATTSIIDANITTLIVAVVLYLLGSGPVRGFAVTLALGIACTVFTAIYVTQFFVAAWFDQRRPKSVSV
jgi:preprotein translocase subunit SecD